MSKKHLSIMKINSLDSLTPSELAWLTHYLIAHEIKPGGPYNFGTENDDAINARVRMLLDVPVRPTRSTQSRASEWDILYQHLVQKFGSTATSSLGPLFESISSTDAHGEISQLSKYFSLSLPRQLRPSTQELRNYSEANQCAWVAYSIYDQILDKARAINLLPIANYLTRRSIHLYGQTEKSSVAEALFARLDAASLVELQARRLILVDRTHNTITIKEHLDSTSLKVATADRSIIHVVGPELITRAAKGVDKGTANEVGQALTKYCYARQLLDDLHDWKDDLETGQPTYVVALLFEATNISVGTHQLDTTLTNLQYQLFEVTLLQILDEVDQALELAIRHLNSFDIDSSSPFIQNILVPLVTESNKARRHHLRNIAFLDSYTEQLSSS